MPACVTAQALKTFRFCTEAYSLIGLCFSEGPEHMRNPHIAVGMYRRGIHCAVTLNPEYPTKKLEWTMMECRPYIRAMHGLAIALFKMGDVDGVSEVA